MIGQDPEVAASLLRQGKLVAIPTETVYGLAANALDPFAVSKIFAAKKRPEFNPLIVHLSSGDEPLRYVRSLSPKAGLLIERFWPGPLSLLFHKEDNIPDIVTAGMDSVVLRMPSHRQTQTLLHLLDFPLAAPSANMFKQISPTTAQHVELGLGDKVEYILDGGPSTVGIESTIVDCRTDDPILLRHGGISKEEIEECIGPVKEHLKQNSNPMAPGQMDQHYSPSKPLFLVQDIQKVLNDDNYNSSIIAWGDLSGVDAKYVYNLSESRNDIEAASNLFKMMHLADSDRTERIYAEILPERGLGRAINDRLRRAST